MIFGSHESTMNKHTVCIWRLPQRKSLLSKKIKNKIKKQVLLDTTYMSCSALLCSEQWSLLLLEGLRNSIAGILSVIDISKQNNNNSKYITNYLTSGLKRRRFLFHELDISFIYPELSDAMIWSKIFSEQMAATEIHSCSQTSCCVCVCRGGFILLWDNN